MTTLPIAYGYARVSKEDDDSRNLETQLRLLADHGICEDLVFSDIATGRTLRRAGWQELMSRLRTGDTLAVVFLDRLSRNFEEGVRFQADLTRRDIGIVAIRENIDSREASAAAKFFRRSMLAQGAYQVDSAAERIKLGLERARAEGKRMGRPPALTPEQVAQCCRMAEEGTGLRHVARVMQCSPATVKKALAAALGRLIDLWPAIAPTPGLPRRVASPTGRFNEICSSWPTWLQPAHRTAVRRPLGTLAQPALAIQLRHHQQPDRGGRLSLVDDLILGNSALDRLTNASYQIVIEGTSYREKLSPHRKLLGDKEGD